MDAKVTVEEMASAVETLITFAGGLRAHEHGAVLVNALAARDYIIAAESQIAEAMTVLSPSMPESGLVDACRQVKQAAISEADNAQKLEALLAERDAQIARMFAEFQTAADDAAREIAEMRKAVGPKCPRCNHWLKADHDECSQPDRSIFFACNQCPSGPGGWCNISDADLITNHPLIAAALGLEANDGK